MILGIVLLMGLCTFVGIKYFPWEPKMNLSGLKKMWYSEGDGGWSYGYHYDLKEKEGTYLLTFEQSFPDPYKKEKNLTADEVKKLEEVIYNGAFSQRNGFEKDNTDVLDGSSWSLNIRYQDGEQISAHGYESYPDDFWKKIPLLTSCLEEFLKNTEKEPMEE